ncbi:hypothetical protein [Corynebacterium nasicanis]
MGTTIRVLTASGTPLAVPPGPVIFMGLLIAGGSATTRSYLARRRV